MEFDGIVASLRVLVVDDNEALREVIAAILSESGCRCESAKNGVEAMQKVRQDRFDAVVTDIEMPDMDGIRLTKEINEHFSDLPVMIVTGHEEDSYREEALRAGAKEFLRKPFGVPDLIMKLHNMFPVQNFRGNQEP